MARILVVDDSRTTRKILRKMLENRGHEVVDEAANGEEAVAKYKEIKPDLTTLDITMPVLDGIGALKQIIDFDSNAKVIMVTAAGQKHKVMEAMKANAAEFITKPLLEEEVMERIDRVLQKAND
ncbi:MAG: response regulator [Bacillota bacterium]|nr:response regulator [Bacillota bacterium]HHU62245.1 response regulator [Natronincola sp.]